MPIFRKLFAAVAGLGLAAESRAADGRSAELLFPTTGFFAVEQLATEKPPAQKERRGVPGFRWLRTTTRPTTLEEEGFPGDFYATPAYKPAAPPPAYKPDGVPP